ncbi:MAG: hypothetical protein JNM63_09510, partial [Spirochaetia bacterium]|nr:hypothetical protein [Spirochaetia bacterium]
MRQVKSFFRAFLNLLSEEEMSRVRMTLLMSGLFLFLAIWVVLEIGSVGSDLSFSSAQVGDEVGSSPLIAAKEWRELRSELHSKNPFLSAARTFLAVAEESPEIADLPGYICSGSVEVGGNKRAFVTDPKGESLYLSPGTETGPYRVLQIGGGEILLVDRSVQGPAKEIL